MATLEDTTLDRLPALPDDIAVRLGAALAPFGYFAPVERPPIDALGKVYGEKSTTSPLNAWIVGCRRWGSTPTAEETAIGAA
jgi:hypothetical protein